MESDLGATGSTASAAVDIVRQARITPAIAVFHAIAEYTCKWGSSSKSPLRVLKGRTINPERERPIMELTGFPSGSVGNRLQ